MRPNEYAPIEDYAVIGDGRTAALVASDGSIDWLCLPDIDSPSVFAAILDAEHGGAFAVHPVEPFEVDRRYVGGTNVLETTFRTSDGAVRLTDAMTLSSAGRLAPMREVVRKLERLGGSIELEWSVEPRFDYARHRGSTTDRSGRLFFTHGVHALALSVWGAEAAAAGRVRLDAGDRVLFSLASTHHRPTAFAGGALVNVLLPAVHPRMGSLWSDASETPILEPPGFMLSNYGPHTALVTVVGHVAYGAIAGGFAAGL